MVMRRSVFSVFSAGGLGLGLAVAALRCNSVIGDSALSPEPCTNNCAACTTYCNSIIQQCPTGGGNPPAYSNWEYLTTDICMQTCSVNFSPVWGNTLPTNDTTTFDCRLASAGDSGGGTSCASAGPLGGTTCVSMSSDPCTTFCQLEFSVCADYVQYDGGVTGCVDYCVGRGPGFYVVPDGGGDLAPHAENGDDTLNCRLYHLQNAMYPGSGGPMAHCQHTGPSGGKKCVSPQDAGATPSADAGAEADAATPSADASGDAAADE
jgi:hypothetical protein